MRNFFGNDGDYHWGDQRHGESKACGDLVRQANGMPEMDRQLVARVKKQAWFHRHPAGLPAALFCLVVITMIFSVFAIEQSDAHRIKDRLARTATELGAAIDRRAAENAAYLRAAAAFMQSADRTQTDPASFGRLVTDFRTAQEDQGSLGLGWAERVAAADVDRFERRQRTKATPGYAVWPKPTKPGQVLFPVTYLVPGTPQNITALGFDMNSELLRRVAMAEAEGRSRPVATAPVLLVQDVAAVRQPGFLIYMPVFRKSPAGRPQLAGFVYSAFRAREFVASAVRLIGNRKLCLSLYDGQVSAARRLLTLCDDNPQAKRATFSTIIAVAGRSWIVQLAERPDRTLTLLSQVVLLFGSVLAVLAMVVAHLVTRRAAEDRKVREWLQGQVSIRTNLTRELNHRVKNTLANVLSIIALTRRRSTDIDEFAEGLAGRIRALSATHDLLTRNEWGVIRLADLVAAELAPYMEAEENHVTLDGPPINLAPNDALSLGLAIHELATNAAKYGALSTLAGRVTVSWRLVETDFAEIHWQERDGPPVTVPERSGFGRDLIEKIVAHELKSPVDLRFDLAGVQCTMRVAVRNPRPFSLRSQHNHDARPGRPSD